MQRAVDGFKLFEREVARLLGELLGDEAVDADTFAEAAGVAAGDEVFLGEQQQAELAHDHAIETEHVFLLFEQPVDELTGGLTAPLRQRVDHVEHAGLGDVGRQQRDFFLGDGVRAVDVRHQLDDLVIGAAQVRPDDAGEGGGGARLDAGGVGLLGALHDPLGGILGSEVTPRQPALVLLGQLQHLVGVRQLAALDEDQPRPVGQVGQRFQQQLDILFAGVARAFTRQPREHAAHDNEALVRQERVGAGGVDHHGRVGGGAFELRGIHVGVGAVAHARLHTGDLFVHAQVVVTVKHVECRCCFRHSRGADSWCAGGYDL